MIWPSAERVMDLGRFGTAHGITLPPGKVRLDIADRPHSRLDRFTRYGHYLSSLKMPSGSLPCDINYLDQHYSVVPALDGPDTKKGAPIYILRDEKLISTIMPKEDLGLPELRTHPQCGTAENRGQVLYHRAGVESGRLRHPRAGRVFGKDGLPSPFPPPSAPTRVGQPYPFTRCFSGLT